MNQRIYLKSSHNLLFVFLFLALTFSVLGQKDTLYYTNKWQLTVKDSASFFRPSIKKEGELFRVQDYFISGQLQMNGLSKSSEKDLWEGKVTWYNEDGSVFQEGTYVKNRLEGDFITFLGNQRLVSIYANGRVISGKRNTTFDTSRQMYFEQEGDTLYEIIYEKNIKGIRVEHYSTKESYRFFSKYYDTNGILIGERTLLPNNYYKGSEVFYSYNPMQVKKINYQPFGHVLISGTYYSNGQIREKVEQNPNWSKTYYSEDGKVLAEITYRLERDRLKPFNGTELFFAYGESYKEIDIVESARTYADGIIILDEMRHQNGQTKSKTTYKNNSKELQVSYDENGKEINRMVYKNYKPYQGTEMQKGRIATYASGELVEEINFFFKTEIPQVKKSKTLETYYDKDGNVLGTLKLEDDNGYPKAKEGKRFSVNYNDGVISGIDEYKEGVLVEHTSFRKRKVGKDQSKTFKQIDEYNSEGYKKIKETKFYSNGKKQSEVTYKNYKKISGKFYNESEKLLGVYDFEKKDGILYKFFSDSDQLELMEELKEGEIERRKRYNYGKNSEYGQINTVIEEDLDIDCCATYYTIEGEIIAKLTFKNQLPWKGTAYDSSDKTKYTIKGGKRNGIYQKLAYDQSVSEEGQFVNDKKEGAFKFYDYQGNLKRTENFENGMLNGKTSFYDTSGTLVSELQYKNGAPITGIKTFAYGYSKERNKETYENGILKERIAYDKKGKSITTFISKNESQTVVFQKNAKTKRLSYGVANNSLDGTVIRYDIKGKEQHRATFSKGRLESGTVQLTPGYQDHKLLYMEVTMEDEKIMVKYISLENKVVLKAEEILIPGSSFNYLNKLNITLDYLAANRLY